MIRSALSLLLLVTAFSTEASQRRRAVQPAPPALSFTFDFRNGSLGWEAGFADYNPMTDMRTTAGIRPLPLEAGGGTAWYLSGWNYSDDLFMFLRGRVGTIPKQNYIVDFSVTFATNAGADCGGIGGAPGQSVYLKMGASPIRPEPVLVDDHLRLNIDKGNQSQSGVLASQAGTISALVPTPCGSEAPFSTVVRTHTHPYAVESSATGDLWLLFGVDSGFEGFNQIYVQRIEATLTPVPASDPRARWQTTYAAMFDLIAEIERAGVVVRESGRLHHDLIGGREISFAVGSPGTLEEIYLYVFDSADDAARAESVISPDGTRIAGTEMNWIGPPHFFRGDHFIANYVGANPLILDVLFRRLGRQFAGADAF
ncbi:MAG TPA: hypothetical protein VMS98_08970 [Thermoanaerobaculia bacterium]|nr:hypothetical protein [Thermoanaerobaculia bacterium]